MFACLSVAKGPASFCVSFKMSETETANKSFYCAGCGQVAYIMERVVVGNDTFHPSCFSCAHCGETLTLSGFSKSQDGRYFCKAHYEQLFETEKLADSTENLEADAATPIAADEPKKATDSPRTLARRE